MAAPPFNRADWTQTEQPGVPVAGKTTVRITHDLCGMYAEGVFNDTDLDPANTTAFDAFRFSRRRAAVGHEDVCVSLRWGAFQPPPVTP